VSLESLDSWSSLPFVSATTLKLVESFLGARVCRLPVSAMLDVYLSRYADVYQPVPEEHSALRKWLGGLRDP
jgi:hypothetical protein